MKRCKKKTRENGYIHMSISKKNPRVGNFAIIVVATIKNNLKN
jgi:hypothetical protein